MILADVTMLAKHYQCDLCRWDWYSIGIRKPDCCPNRDCRSREWDGKKQKRKPASKPKIEIELPKPRRIKPAEDDGYEF